MKNTFRKTSSLIALPMVGILAATVAVSGCSRDDTTAGNPDRVESRTEQRTDEIRADASKSFDDAKQNAREATQDIRQSADNTAERVGDKVADAVITTTVNAELAKDKSLSAMKIDVDTAAGRVALRGTAPDEASRERATQLAMAVKGVVNVDNQLKIDNKM